VTDSSEPAAPAPTDEEREAVVARLTEQTGTGRLTLAEFDERARRAYLATSRAELAAVTADLPAPSGPVPTRRRARRWAVAVLGGSTIGGRWRMSESMWSVAVLGGNTLDLRGVEVDAPEVTITTVALLGGDEIYVPEGVEVELSGFALFGGDDLHGRANAARPGAPVVRIRSFAFLGGVEVYRVPADADPASLGKARNQAKKHWM
jgi:hypothetical protein